MNDKTYTLADLITNLRAAKQPEGVPIDSQTMAWTVASMLGLDVSTLGAAAVALDEFDRALTAVGL